jgi:hypothetical protein
VPEQRELSGGVALFGEAGRPAIRHGVAAEIMAGSDPKHPLVHMVCWDEKAPHNVELCGRVTLAGDEDAPIEVRMSHRFDNLHEQKHSIEPMDHSLTVRTRVAEPIHHALQMRTPLELRFANPWRIASDYRIDLQLRGESFVSIQVTGATVAAPQPPPEPKPVAPIITHPLPHS